MSEPATRLMREFLKWVAERPERSRTYAETMEAWRTSCPRLSVWEDAVSDGLVRVAGNGGELQQATVTLTPRGKEVLEKGLGVGPKAHAD